MRHFHLLSIVSLMTPIPFNLPLHAPLVFPCRRQLHLPMILRSSVSPRKSEAQQVQVWRAK